MGLQQRGWESQDISRENSVWELPCQPTAHSPAPHFLALPGWWWPQTNLALTRKHFNIRVGAERTSGLLWQSPNIPVSKLPTPTPPAPKKKTSSLSSIHILGPTAYSRTLGPHSIDLSILWTLSQGERRRIRYMLMPEPSTGSQILTCHLHLKAGPWGGPLAAKLGLPILPTWNPVPPFFFRN